MKYTVCVINNFYPSLHICWPYKMTLPTSKKKKRSRPYVDRHFTAKPENPMSLKTGTL